MRQLTHSPPGSVLCSPRSSSASFSPLSSPYHTDWLSLSGFIIFLFFHPLPRFSLTHKKAAWLQPPVSHLLSSQFCITKALELSRPRQDFPQQVRDKIILGVRGGEMREAENSQWWVSFDPVYWPGEHLCVLGFCLHLHLVKNFSYYLIWKYSIMFHCPQGAHKVVTVKHNERC